MRLALLGIALVLSAAMVACRDDESETVSHGSMPPRYEPSVKLVPGEYRSPGGLPEAETRAAAATEEDNAKPRFKGVVNGIRLYPFGDSDVKNHCGGSDFEGFDTREGLRFGYLPPGTFAHTPQYAPICPDGSVAGYGQEFAVYNASFNVWYSVGELAFVHGAPADRIEGQTVAGRPGVVIRPVSAAGVGQSWVAFPLADGIVVVDAVDMPLEEIMRIAEGIECANC